jgi:putative nucleotidyltransferase with HDIG domain
MKNLKEGLAFIEKIDALSAMPSIAMDVMGMLNDPSVSVKEITDKIRLDPAMVAFVLKNCNSPLYGIRSEVTSILRAINLLGYSNLKSILMSYFMKNLYHLSGRSDIKEQLWKHSIATAVFSKNLCNFLNMDGEDGYVAGLLHDIGKMILYLDDHQKYEEVIEIVSSGKNDFITAERNLLKFTHVDTGYFLLEKWKFSEILKDVVLYHHDLELFMGSDRIIGVVAFANLLTHVFLEKRFENLDQFLELFDIQEKDLDKIVESTTESVQEFYSIL